MSGSCASSPRIEGSSSYTPATRLASGRDWYPTAIKEAARLYLEYLNETGQTSERSVEAGERFMTKRWSEIRRDEGVNGPGGRCRGQRSRAAGRIGPAAAFAPRRRGHAGGAGFAPGQEPGNVSELERREDVYLSSLREYVEALGGRLELTAVFDDDRARSSGLAGRSPFAKTAAPYDLRRANGPTKVNPPGAPPAVIDLVLGVACGRKPTASVVVHGRVGVMDRGFSAPAEGCFADCRDLLDRDVVRASVRTMRADDVRFCRGGLHRGHGMGLWPGRVRDRVGRGAS